MLSLNIKNILLKRNDECGIILSGVKFNASRGNCYSVLGRNGAGKTTLLKAIALLLDDDFIVEGDISWGDLSYSLLSPEETAFIRNKVMGIIFQDPHSSLDPLKKLSYYLNLLPKENKLLYFLEQLDFPGYENFGKYFPYELSGGMAQKFQIALNFALDKEVYLLDEPTSALDTISIKRLSSIIKSLSEKGKTFIIVTQDKPFAAMISNKIIKID